jgi:predicted glutamine amidotransferase
MCRWLAYSGSPILLKHLLYRHALIDHRLGGELGPHTTNGDGFGVGWYEDSEVPALYRAIDPVWSDQNLREISGHIRSRLVFAHVRASSGAPVQHSNCHPFRHGKWLWMHNGLIDNFEIIKRELVLGIDPALYPEITGSSDTEIFFFLALTFGLEDNPILAVERAVGFIEQTGTRAGIEYPMRMSVAATDGRDVWGFRYSTARQSPSLHFSTSVHALRKLYPEIAAFQVLSDESRMIVSEPLSGLEDAWNEVDESTCAVIRGDGQHYLHPFTPRQSEPRAVLGDPPIGSCEIEVTTRTEY